LTDKLNHLEAQNLVRQVKEVNGINVLTAKIKKRT